MVNKVNELPAWAAILYRAVRAAVGAGIAQTVLLQPDWSNPQQASKVLAVAFGTGFMVAFGKWLRDVLDKYFDQDEKSLTAKVMPI